MRRKRGQESILWQSGIRQEDNERQEHHTQVQHEHHTSGARQDDNGQRSAEIPALKDKSITHKSITHKSITHSAEIPALKDPRRFAATRHNFC